MTNHVYWQSAYRNRGRQAAWRYSWIKLPRTSTRSTMQPVVGAVAVDTRAGIGTSR